MPQKKIIKQYKKGGQNPPKFVTDSKDPSLQSYRDSLNLAINSRRAEAEYLNRFRKSNISKSTASFELPSLMTMVKTAKDSYNPLVDLIKNGLPKGDNSRQVVNAFSADTITQAADVRKTTVNGKIPRQINSGKYIPNSVANKKIPLIDNSTTGDDTKDYPQTDLKNIATKKGNITQENITPSRRYIHNNRVLSDVEDPFIGYSTPSGNRYKLTDVYQPSYSTYRHPTIKPEKTDQFYYNSAETTDDPSSFNYQANEMYNVNFPIYEYPHNPVYLKDAPISKPTIPAKTQMEQLQIRQFLLPVNKAEQLSTQQLPLPSFTPKLPTDYSITMRNVNPNLKNYSEEQIEFKTPQEQEKYITDNRLHRLSTGMYEDTKKYQNGGTMRKKIRIKTVPVMQSGGYNPMTPQQRDAWNRQQVAARQQDFIGNEHSREPGNQFMQSQGMDPNQLGAYQADLLEQRNTSPWGKRAGAYMTPGAERDFSPADSHYGDDTAREMYTSYAVQQNNQPAVNFGTDWKAATAYSGQLEAARQNEWQNFGKPQANINYRGADAIYPENRIAEAPTTPKPTGLAATGFPTREEAIAKYQARKASGQELPSNYFLKGNPDYSIDTLRRTGKGSDEYAYGGNVTKRVRITGLPTMAEGGYANTGASRGYGNQQAGQGYALNRFWNSPAGYPGSTSQVNPYGKVGNTLPEAKDGGDINAEKQEMVLGDFDQDGQQELMNVDGPPHTEGGKNVNVPSNSFVFSDTKDLKIKDPQILAMFGMAPKRGGYTPAFIAKKYDLNKLKKILDDPNADEMSKKTAQLMNDNYLSKLNKLAQVQEGMKGAMGMEHHDPERGQVSAQEPPVEIAGNMGPGGAEMMQPEVMFRYGGVPYMAEGGDPDEQSVYNMYPNNLTAEGYVHERPTPENVQSFIQQSIQPRPAGYKPGNLTNDQYDKMRRRGWDGKSNPGEWAQINQYDQVQAALKESGLTKPATDATSKNQLGNAIREGRWEAFEPQGPDYNPTIKDVTAVQDVTTIQDPYSDYPVPWAGNRFTPPTTPTKKEEEEDKNKGKGAKQRRGIFMNPNLYGDAMNLAQMAQLRKFVPYEPVPQAVIPETVFMDPTRAIAAQQEMARNAMEMAGQSANSRAARANNLAVQGIAGTQAADIIGQYGNQNVGIANAANAQAAQITNQLMAMEANRLEELNKGNFLAARDYQREMGRLQAEWADRKQKQHDTAVKRAWLNKTSPYFNVGMNDMPEFKPGMDAKFYADLKSGDDPTIGKRITELMKEGASRGDAIEQVKLERGQSSTKRTDPFTGAVTTSKGAAQETKYGGMMRYGGSHMAMPQMAPQYQIGGSALSLPATDNTAYMMPPQSFEPMQANSEENPLSGLPTKKASRRDIATMTNNPGNMIYTPKFGKMFGAVDSGIKQRDGKGHFAMFPDLTTGLKAYQTQLFGEVDGVMKSNYYKKDTTVDQALKTWSNKGYNGDIYPEIKNKKLGELTMAERNELAKRQIKHESGDMYKLLRERGVFKYGGSALQKFMR
jgi:hypothetical protein